VLSSDFHCKESDGTIWFSGSYPYTQDRKDSTDSDHDFMNTIITGDEYWVYRCVPETKPFR
jgi:hypothetical protein